MCKMCIFDSEEMNEEIQDTAYLPEYFTAIEEIVTKTWELLLYFKRFFFGPNINFFSEVHHQKVPLR